jgi:transposase InsO family protein
MDKQSDRGGQAAKGRRYSPGEREAILQDAGKLGVAAAAAKHGCSKWTIYDWRGQDRRAAQRAGEGGDAGESSDDSRRDDRHRLILELWRQHPGLGPSQIRNLLKRKGFKASVNTVRALMEEHGYVHPKLRRKEHTGRYEAIRPLQLVHLDFFHFHVHRQKQCLLFVLDDYSRFITGFTLLKSEHADGAIRAFEESVARYGKPEAVMTDRGAAFHAFTGISRFERLLEELEISHFLAEEAAVNGKSEALNAAVQKELVRQIELVDLGDALRQVGVWVRFYNYKRPHHSLGGILVPADRFHGWQDETMRRLEAGQDVEVTDLSSPDGRALEVFKVVSVAGQPSVYLMGKKVFG